MKKTIAFLLTLCMAFSAIACSKEETTKKKKTKKTTEEVETEDPDETEKTKKTKVSDEDDPTTTTTEEPTTTTEEPTTTDGAVNTTEPSTVRGGVPSGSDVYNELTNKMIASAKSICNAKEADDSQYRRIVKEMLTPTNTMFSDGVYAVISGDDATDLTAWGFQELYSGASTNGTLFCKTDGETAFLVFIVEMVSEDNAVALFRELYGMTGNADEKSMRDMKQGTDLQCGFKFETDKEAAFYISSESKDTCVSMYFRVDGNVVTAGVYNGKASVDLCPEFNSFMKDAEIIDYEALVADFS